MEAGHLNFKTPLKIKAQSSTDTVIILKNNQFDLSRLRHSNSDFIAFALRRFGLNSYLSYFLAMWSRIYVLHNLPEDLLSNLQNGNVTYASALLKELNGLSLWGNAL